MLAAVSPGNKVPPALVLISPPLSSLKRGVAGRASHAISSRRATENRENEVSTPSAYWKPTKPEDE
jgi:hypothetical protein